VIAEKAGLKIYDEDEFTVERINDILDAFAVGQRIIVRRATPVYLEADGKTLLLRSQAGTVGEFFEEKGVVLQEHDFANLPLGTKLSAGLRIKLTRVGYIVRAEEEVVPRPIRIIWDTSQPPDYERIQQEGRDGLKITTYKVKLHNGQIADKSVLQTVVLTQALEQVVVRGSYASGDVWAALRQCEAGGDYSRNSGNGYYGAYQFSPGTWTGYAPDPYKYILPHQAPPSIQDEAARLLQAARGWQPWPGCRAKLGLP
jgi:uncharacterized protein YabE (DUF348 family)